MTRLICLLVILSPLVVTTLLGSGALIVVAALWAAGTGGYWIGFDDGVTTEKEKQAFAAIERQIASTRQHGD